MTDLALRVNGDLTIGPTGDLAVVTGTVLAEQRILRRLLTNPGDYIWQLTYGAGLGGYIGSPVSALAVAGIVRSQMLLEPAIAANPAPVVSSSISADGTMEIAIQYRDSNSGIILGLSFSL